MTKGKLRTELLGLLKQQKEESRRRKSEAIRRKVLRLPAFRRASTVCCYVALPYEVQTWRLIEDMLALGKKVAVPVTIKRTKCIALSEVRDPSRELAPGAFGVLEPIPAARRPVRVRDVSLAIVPGLAFDRMGHRLGHGDGYYDRFLARLPKSATTVGLAFCFQILERLPVASHDFPVHRVLTA